jgi:hypothetical protein
MLREALPGTAVSGESTFEEAVKPAPDQPPKRFDHYESVTGEGGKPTELGESPATPTAGPRSSTTAGFRKF